MLVKVTELARDPDSDLSSICELLRNDGPLAANIIRISNSTYYAPATPHGNLASAINYIGMKEVTRVVSLSLSRRIFARDLPSYGLSASDYWTASIASALVMEALAKQSGLNPEDAYTIGILHAIGRVLIDQVIDEKRFTLYWVAGHPIEEWERLSVGFDFAESGALLLEHWRFPKPTCEVIRCQLNPEEVGAPVSLLGALQFTMRLLLLTGLNFDKDWKLPESDPFVEASGLRTDAVEEMVSTCRRDFESIIQSVGMG